MKPCPTRATLLADFKKAAKEYSASVRGLSGAAGSSETEVVAELRKAAEEARQACERARTTLRLHLETHECSGGTRK